MRIVVIGASGPTGRQLTGQALAAGHHVTAVSRRPRGLPRHDRLTVVAADATDPAAIAPAVAGAGAVLSALGVTPSRKPVTTYSAAATAVVTAMRRHGVRRLMVVSSSVLDAGWRPSNAFFFNHVLDPYVNRVLVRQVHQDMRRMEEVVRSSDLDWTIVRPSGLFEHPTVTDHLVAEGSADGVFTARADLAAAMLRELDERRFSRRAMGVATTDVKPGLVRLVRDEVLRSPR
ncbi:NAD(P)H-binding protein [Micromonospora purpureochromogenes]|uniref:NAD(P)-dependent oxidoreductase n=1 Tax=Micromonospora purpureochromogenes TaxID=47872 RepID=UPI0033D14626